MIRQATAMRVRQDLDEILREVQYRKGKVMITKAGKPVAAIVDIDLFERIQKLDDEFDSLIAELARGFSTIDQSAGLALIDEAVQEARQSPKG